MTIEITVDAVDLSPVRQHIEMLIWVDEQKAHLKVVEDAAKSAIQELMGSHDSGYLDGREVFTWKTAKANKLDQKLLKQLHPDIAAECMGLSEVRTFRSVK